MKTSLEGLRGTAALIVLFFHAVPALMPNGYLAVDLFFVLSGFVMNTAYGSFLTDAGTLRVFLIRRIGRLWPVYLATTALLYAVFALAHPGRLPTAAEAFALVTLTQALHTFNGYVGNPTAWSISVEFYTYLVFAAVCLTLRGRARIAAFAALSVIGYAVTVYVRHGQTFDVTYDFGLARCFAGFFAGALVAHLRLHVSASAQFTALAVAAWLLFGAAPVFALAAPLVFAFLIAALANDAGPVARAFQCDTAQYLGRVSYALYLGHPVALAFLMYLQRHFGMSMLAVVLAYFPASFLLAHVLNVFIETPARRYAYSLSAPRVSAACRA